METSTLRQNLRRRALAAAALLLVSSSLCARAAGLTLSDVSPHVPAEAPIIWKALTNGLPRSLWTYKKLPQNFSGLSISNALLLGAFKLKPLPRSFTKPVTIWDTQVEGDPRPDYFAIDPNFSLISFRRQRRVVGEGDRTPAALLARVWKYAAELGLNKADLTQGVVTDNSVSLFRVVDGIPFREDMEGISVQFGAKGEICFFNLNWPKLERVAQQRTASPQDITRCIRAFKAPVLPADYEPDYLGRVKSFGSIRSLTITNLNVYYSEGRLGEQLNEQEPETHVAPIIMIEALADWATSNAPVRLLAPLTMPDARKLLTK
jgi:hypothetical protein